MSAIDWFTAACLVAFALLIAAWWWVRSLSEEDEEASRLDSDNDNDPY